MNGFLNKGYELWLQSKGILLLFFIVTMILLYFNSRYMFGRNGAISNCLHTHYFIVDTWDKDLNNGDIAAFYQQNENPFFKKGQKWIKQVAAQGGDKVIVKPHKVIINHSTIYPIRTQYILKKLQKDFSALKHNWEISENEYFFIGQSNTSFDSRYWGTVNKKDIIGKAYAVF